MYKLPKTMLLLWFHGSVLKVCKKKSGFALKTLEKF